ncbi:MAG: PspC domain-containing protein [Eubacteriaceae bacterium]|nr:PspC domain-containing protein [Eubacteriaceae bacterium]
MNKTLAKSSTDRKITGVCGGIAEYLNVDSTIIRLVFALSIIFWGFGLLIYIIAAIIMPMDYEADNNKQNYKNNYSAENATDYANNQTAKDTAQAGNTDNLNNSNAKKDFDGGSNNTGKKSNLSTAAIFGIVLVVIGVICLVNIFIPAINYGVIFAALIVALGVLIIIKGGR